MSNPVLTNYDKLVEEVELLSNAKDWQALRAWFSYWENEEELIDKILLWGKFFLPDYLRDESPPFHRELIRGNFSTENEYDAAPRGFSKTTINQLCISFQIVNNMEKFIVVIEKNHTEAAEVLSAVRLQFDSNPMILTVYGNMVKRNQAGIFNDKNKDAEGDVLINGVRLRGKGFNTPIRGLKSNEWRPTKIYVDDVEEDTHINSAEQRQKYRENYTAGIIPAVEIDCTIKVRGTILHNDSLLKNLIDQHGGKIYKAYDKMDPKNTLLWPTRWTFARLEKKKADMLLEGLGTSKFFQEYLNEPVDDERRTFKWEWLHKEFTDEDLRLRALARFAVLDVADSKNDGADFTGEILFDWDQDNNWFVQRAKRHKLNSPELIERIFQIWVNDRPAKIGVEKKAFEFQIKPWLKIMSEERGIYPIVVELEPRGRNKEDRIRGALEGRFQAGKIWFKKDAVDNTKELKGELYDFPSSKNDDLSDALAYGDEVGYRPFGKSKEQMTATEKEFLQFKKKALKKVASRF